MSYRFDPLEARFAGQGRQLGDSASALKSIQDFQATAAEWQAQVSSHMSAADTVIEELSGR